MIVVLMSSNERRAADVSFYDPAVQKISNETRERDVCFSRMFITVKL